MEVEGRPKESIHNYFFSIRYLRSYIKFSQT